MGLIDMAPGLEWLDDQMNKKNSIPLTPDKTDQQLAVGNDLAKYLQSYLPNYQPGKPYTGQLTAGTTSQEQQSLALLTKLMGQNPTGPLTGQASQVVSDTLKGNFDPRTSPVFNASQAQINRNTQDAIDAARRSAGARGEYFTEGAARDESRLRATGAESLNSIIAGLYDSERNRQLSAVPLATGIDQFTMDQGLRQIDAGQRYGSLNRIIEDTNLERQYQDFQRMQAELGAVPGQAQNYFGTSINYGLKDLPMPNPLMQIISSLAPVAGSVAGFALGGPAGAAAGGAAGNALGSSFSQPSSTIRANNDYRLGSYYPYTN